MCIQISKVLSKLDAGALTSVSLSIADYKLQFLYVHTGSLSASWLIYNIVFLSIRRLKSLPDSLPD